MISLSRNYSIESGSHLAELNVMSYYSATQLDVKGIVQICHGMAEHLERYEEFIDFLTSSGYVVFIHDHLGHGKSVKNDDELGYFGEKDGYKTLVNDVKLVTDLAKDKYPELPVFLFGHSMGSFIARYYTQLYSAGIKGAVFCGTAGPNPGAKVGVMLANMIIKQKGSHYRSKLIDKIAFGSYNKKCRPQRTPFDWLTKDNAIVDKYIDDKYCGFLFTAAGYRDLFNLLITVNRPEWFTSFNNDFPVFLIAGEDDPVGSYGAGVKKVYDSLVSAGHNNVGMKLYPGDRHEILNETDKKNVFADVLMWLEKTNK